MKELKRIDSNTVIHCSTQEEWDKVCEIVGLDSWKKWIMFPLKYGESSPCINPQSATWGPHDGFKEIGKKIFQASEFIALNSTPEIPEKWCVKRTPENASILEAWRIHKFDQPYWEKYYEGRTNFLHNDGIVLFEPTEDEITFEQWQTIPEVKEWLKTYNMENFKKYTMYDESQTTITTTETIPFQRVEEREIIGYEAPEIHSWNIKKGEVFIKTPDIDRIGYCLDSTDKSFRLYTLLPAEWVETWKPIYKQEDKYELLQSINSISECDFANIGWQYPLSKWIEIFPFLTKQDIETKTDWFKKVV